MTRANESADLDVLYAALMPALSKASVGDFSGEVPIDAANDPRVNELLVGVQVLLDVINEKNLESRDHGVTLLDEVLKKAVD